MSPLTVVAKVVARKDAVEPLTAELHKLVAPTRLERGCIAYTLHQDLDDPTVFLFYEIWEDAACLEQHMNSDHFKGYVRAAEGMILEKQVQIMTRIA